MCGRFILTRSGRELAEEFELSLLPELAPRYNIAPSQDIAVVRAVPEGRELCSLRWGLVPTWAKDPAVGNRMINARSETVADKPAFRSAMRHRRCIVPADGFYEWSGAKGRRQPHLFRVRGGLLFGIAGLWEQWRSPEGRILETCALLTTQANANVRAVHHRMPVILDAREYARWLGADPPEALLGLLSPCPPDWISGLPVGPRVNDARHEGPGCVEPADPV